MIPLFASMVFAHMNGVPSAAQDNRTVMLAAAMVRHQEPVGKGGVRATVAEIYPIAWESRGQYTDASFTAEDASPGPVRPGDRFEIYKSGWNVGWFDVNRVAAKPYVSDSKVVGLGGWSLPRKLYPYRLDRTTNLNYLWKSVYDWGNDKYKNSVQPFLALSTPRRSLSSTEFSPSQIKRDLLPVVQENIGRIAKQVDRSVSSRDLRLETLRAYDFDNDRVPEVVAVYAMPGGVQRNLFVVATIEASAFIERYHAVHVGVDWEPFDVLDVDGDGYKELVLLGKGNGRVSFQVIHGDGGKMQKVFEGASFGR